MVVVSVFHFEYNSMEFYELKEYNASSIILAYMVIEILLSCKQNLIFIMTTNAERYF